MHVLLRHRKTGLFYQCDDHWIGDAEAAHDFGSSANAILFVHERRLSDIEVILAFDDPRYNISLPVNSFWGSASPD